MKSRKIKRFFSNAAYYLFSAILLVLIIMVISSRASGGEPQLFGYQLKTVLSGSMEPTFKTGSLILVERIKDARNLKKNQIITFKKDEKNLVTHRIIEVIKQGDKVFYRTKGDRNEDPDMQPVLSNNVVARYSGVTIPFIGYVLEYASKPIGIAILLIIPGLFLLGFSGFTIRAAIKELEEKAKTSVNAHEKNKKLSN